MTENRANKAHRTHSIVKNPKITNSKIKTPHLLHQLSRKMMKMIISQMKDIIRI